MYDIVGGFIQVVSAAWEPDSGSSPGSADFVVRVLATKHCTNTFGETTIGATIGGFPSGGHWTFSGVVDPQGYVVLPVVIPVAGEPATVKFHLAYTAPKPGVFMALADATPTMPEGCGVLPGRPELNATLTVH
jgi:hypothetical protein